MRYRNFLLNINVAMIVGLVFVAPSTADTLLLRPGFQRILDHGAVTRIAVGNPEIVEARPLPKGDGVLVVGKKVGETDLVLWERGEKIHWDVAVREKNSLFEETRTFAESIPGIAVAENGRFVMVSGTVTSHSDRKLLEEFARSRPGLYLRLSSPEDQRSLLAYDLKIIEISKGSTSQLGIRWPDSLAVKGSLTAGGDAETALTVASDFEMRLNLLLANGRARILANPHLVCESGESASFLAGGEIPIVIVTQETRSVEWKTYGIILNLQPKMDAQGRIRTQITAEISTVDHGSGSSQVPAFLTRRVTTNFSGPSGGTVMLSGLIKSEMAKDVAKVPLLGQIPILGELFKSRSFRENQTELAIFITPAQVKEDAAGESSFWLERARQEKGLMHFRILD